jgi:hypothetical protein
MTGSNQTTVATTGMAAAMATVLVTIASIAGVDLDQTQAVAVSGALITLVTIAVGYFHKPA